MDIRRIGILGGGQLAKMTASAAYRLGFETAIFEKFIDSPAGVMTKYDFGGLPDDEISLKNFLFFSDIITLENEFIDSNFLASIESQGKKVLPSSHTIALIQDKYIQKQTLRAKGIPVGDFMLANGKLDYEILSKNLGNCFILKSRTMGYDGYGNREVDNDSSFQQSYDKLISRTHGLFAEKKVLFEKELAIMLARSKNEFILYPVVETIQKNHICQTVIAPAQIPKKALNEIKEIAIEAVKAVEGIGIFGIELFYNDNEILVNEMAPRPHNSGHYSIEGCRTSQFENHVRSVLELPLGNSDLTAPYAVMINLLGKKNNSRSPGNYHEILSEKNAHMHIYGKAESRIGRKMGHITMTGDSLSDILVTLNRLENLADF